MLALGVVPVSTREWFTDTRLPVGQGGDGRQDAADLLRRDNFEAIIKQQPDLILAIYETINKETYDKLSQIAPTVIQYADYADEQTPWDVQTLTTGKALGKSSRGAGPGRPR